MQKRRTRATIAKEKDLEPLADALFALPTTSVDELAQPFINEEKEVLTIEDALAGARDIIAENIADDAAIRETIRKATWSSGKITSTIRKDAEDEKKVFGNYYEYEEPLNKIVPHRTLALNRGEKEKVLGIGLAFPEDQIIGNMERTLIEKRMYPLLHK